MFDGILRRTSSLTWRHPRALLAAILLFAAVAGFFGHDVERHLSAAGFADPASPSEKASRVLADELGHSAEPGLVVLVRPADGDVLDVADPAIRAEVGRLAGQVAKGEYIGRVDNPLTAPDPAATGLVSTTPDGKVTSLVLAAYLTDPDVEDKGGVADESVRKLVKSDLVDVGFGGYAPSFNEVNDQTREDLTKAELIAFPILGILLLLVFRSLIAMFIPLVVGGLSIIGTLLALRIMSSFVDTSLFALNIATALSLGLAVDYALLIVSRHREEVAKHGYTETALRNTISSAGRTVLFSGLTVAGAMTALVLMPQRFLYSIGVAGGVVGILSAVMAVLVVPAVLAWLGPNVNKFSIRTGPAVSDASTGWLRLARGVMRRPVLVAVATTVALLTLAWPLADTHLTGPSSQAVPPGAQAYGVTQYLNANYPRAVMEGVSLTVTGEVSDAELERLTREVGAVAHVDGAVPPFQRVSDDLAVTTLALDGPALSETSQDAVREIKDLSVGSGELLVSGNTARFIDQKVSLAQNAPMVVGLIVLLTLVLLFLLTGSVLLPLKTLVMNALTLSAVLGILVIVFEKKVGASLLDYPGPYAVEVTSMVFLFVVTFALATDYAVLVMARIKELRDGGMTNEEAVAQGVARTGRIISAAALMIAVVFAAFAVSPVFFMKQIAVGMALAVIIDATVVRALLVPSLMRLLGEANWWAPKPLRRFHERFGIREG
ncbi:MMPL family transporter [Nocardioides cavernaquae]|uniref:MMPL family transporter n=1 Tax=Nocardioides cavernaquae TaxID=2321396 RepID=A0A3A5HC43_9ACTN|nr:MMPL family transporter [Nocardioides cavernaquae]RJS45547.1 MMPL family transporter [Nocardioides cavernaquae]